MAAPKIIPAAIQGRYYQHVPAGYDAMLLAEECRHQKFRVHLVSEEKRLDILQSQIRFFNPDVRILTLPGWDCLPYDRVSPHPEVVSQRMTALSSLSQPSDQPVLLLVTASAFLQKIPPKSFFENASLHVKAGDRHSLDSITGYLSHHAYQRVETVREVGEYAVRGGILDIFPSGAENPVRLDFFGDEVESLRLFDPLSQRTLETVPGIQLNLAQEVVLDEVSQERFRHQYRAMFGPASVNDPLYESVKSGVRHVGMEHWLPLFFEEMAILPDLIPAGAVYSLDEQVLAAAEERYENIQDYYTARKDMEGKEEVPYRPLPPEKLYLESEKWQTFLNENPLVFGHFTYESGLDKGGRLIPGFAAERQNPEINLYHAVRDYIREQQAENRLAVLVAYSEGSRQRLLKLFHEHDVRQVQIKESWMEVTRSGKTEVPLIVLPFERGFSCPGFVFITEQDILGDRLAQPRRRRRQAEAFIAEASALQEGDLVVHDEHGIARYEGLETLVVEGISHDFLKLVYAGNDRLYLPVENLEVLSRYGHDEGQVQLDKLGGVAWQARKARIKKDLLAMAQDLLKIAAARLLKQGDILPVPEGYDAFCARFPYPETPDQQRAIDEALADLQLGRPMDRLVCGDVGFGKTEVALRAAFVAAMNGVQVAIIAPTTLLARQHTETFQKRFAGFPLKIAQLSRFVKPADAKLTRDGLKSGDINIVIGTHALLSERIDFSQLGLVIVDEEQRFGVKQKERLKNLRDDVHVLTLTATPIPRTLQLSLTGVKDLSLISTPPVDRMAVRTFVMPLDRLVIREAILREKHRGGQSFFVVPRIKDLAEAAELFDEILPEIRYSIANGQMPAEDLEDVMSAFVEGKYDVLISTHIVESGLDIPQANTMIIHHADQFGLAQLYQLRGRIGRSKLRAYAYLTLDPRKTLTHQARQRLEVMQTLDHLGAGFTLASHDLDIRGAGNLLGEAQSGHIKEVGIELYQQMLEEAVAESKAGTKVQEKPRAAWSPQINMGISVMIPEKYVADLGVRLSLYRRIAEIESREASDAFAAELIDRFGPLPEEVENLFEIVALKSLCRQAHIHKLEAGPKGGSIVFYQNTFPHPDKLVGYIQSQAGTIKIRPDQSLVIMRPWQNLAERLRGVRSLLEKLAQLAV